MHTPITIVTYRIHELIDYVNWIYFFHSWGFQPKFAAIGDIHGCDSCRAMWLTSFPENERLKASEAMQLHKEAIRLLNMLDAEYKIYGIYRLMDANADGDSILLDGKVFPMLRQQTLRDNSRKYLCLSDFVRPLNQGIKDTVGIFATTVDKQMEELFQNDEYKSMLVKTLCERLAEAAIEKMHQTIRTEVWGYGKGEKLTKKQLLNGEFKGIRPAVGYPSLPDLSVNFILEELLNCSHFIFIN